MPKINGNQIVSGAVIEHDGGLWLAVKTNAVKPGKGGAFNQVELKNLMGGHKLNERFRAGETVDAIDLELKDFSFLYARERAAFLQDGMKVTLRMHESRPISIKLPPYVALKIVEADPVVRGQSAVSSYKPAMLENGLRVLVPPLIGSGEKIVVDTNKVTYMRRAD